MNVLLGLGTALSPLLIAFFTDFAEWWYLPLVTGAGLLAFRALSVAQPLVAESAGAGPRGRVRIPPAFWLFAAALVAYGVCETMFGNWGTTLVRDGGTPATTANQLGYGIAAFGAGALEHSISLSAIFAAVAVLAVAMALLATRVVRAERQVAPA